MTEIAIQRGDIFCTANPQGIGKAISLVQRIWRPDSEGEYGHAGIILSGSGLSLEALWTVKLRNIFEAYAGEKILIGRPIAETRAQTEKKMRALHELKSEYEGQFYPVWRLLLFLCPPLAKLNFFSKGVCSELVAGYLYRAGYMSYWSGAYPDTLADMIRNWGTIKLIYEGVLE